MVVRGSQMKYSAFRTGAILLLLFPFVLVSSAAQAVLVMRTATDTWQVIEVEKLAINTRSKIRLGSAGSLTIQPADYKKMGAEEVLRAGTLRQHAGGYLV